MMKKVRKLLALVLSLALVLGGVSLAGIEPVSAKSDFEFGGDAIEDCIIGEYTSFSDFKTGSLHSTNFLTWKDKESVIGSVKINMDCILYVRTNAKGYWSHHAVRVYSDAGCTTLVNGLQNNGDNWVTGELNGSTKDAQFIITKGTTLYFKPDSDYAGSVILGYSDINSLCTISCKEAKKGVNITVESKEEHTKVKLLAVDDFIKPSAYYAKGTKVFTIGDDIYEKDKDTITVDKAGEYGLGIIIADSTKTIFTVFTYNINTKDYMKGSGSKTSKLEAPLVALAKTNVVVGYATPNTKVSVKQGKKTYTATADDTGLYAVITGKLRKGSTIKIWEGTDSTGSAALSVKIK